MLNVGTVLQQRYQIIQPLGGGGMGNVYLAADLRLGGRRVVVKENRGGDSRQFHIEANLLANLSHPNLPRVTDHFIEPPPVSGLAAQYLVMDYVEGQNLETMMQQRGPFAERTALALLRQIFSAVEYLHANRIIHRDIKPQNIIVTPQGNAMLVDFGIAKVMASGQSTFTGARAGSPGFAPPEQYTGGTTERSDVYALGATLYYMLTGRVPPESPNRLANASLVPPRQLNSTISANTETAILTAMNLYADQRHGSVSAMEQALRGNQVTAAVSQLPPTMRVSAPTAAMETLAPSIPVATHPMRRQTRPVLLWFIGGIALLGLAALFFLVLWFVSSGQNLVAGIAPTAAPTWTATATLTPSLVPSAVATRTPTNTQTAPASITAVPTFTATLTPSPSRTPLPKPTLTPVPKPTRTPTPKPTATNTATPEPTAPPPPPAQVSPANGLVLHNYPRTATFSWNPVSYPGGVTYNIEIQINTGSWQAFTTQTGIGGTSFNMGPFSGDNQGRWRVWSTSPTTGDGPTSGWWGFSFNTAPAVYSSGSLNIPQTYQANLDAGTVGSSGADIWFEAVTATARYITPINGALIAAMSSSAVGKSDCMAAPVSGGEIDVNLLPAGTFVCVRTDQGRYSALRVNAAVGPSPGTLSISYTTWY